MRIGKKVQIFQQQWVGKPLYNAKDVASNLEKVGRIVESLDKLENKIKREVKSDSRIRGGGEIGLYER